MLDSGTLAARVYDAVISRAEADYPEETCGLIFDTGTDLDVLPMENKQNEMHAQDPENFPRDAKKAYYFDPVEFQKVIAEREESGQPLRSIYHSHPDHEANFSDKDREDAVPPDWGEPLFPDTVYVVVSVKNGKAGDVRGYQWCEVDRDFEEIEILRGN